LTAEEDNLKLINEKINKFKEIFQNNKEILDCCSAIKSNLNEIRKCLANMKAKSYQT